jgi:two-component sensor histidine kinase
LLNRYKILVLLAFELQFNLYSPEYMDFYKRKNRWKIYLAISGACIIALSILYSNYLARSLAERERAAMDIWVDAYRMMGDTTLDDVSFQLTIIQQNNNIPVLVTDGSGEVRLHNNFGKNPSVKDLQKALKSIQKKGYEPIKIEFLGEVNYLYYKNSRILELLNYFPFIQLFLIATFIILGYAGFSNARKAEQNLVWVGMAKETAHQLGTPISAMMAWIEHLKSLDNLGTEQLEIVHELETDVQRLELVAERFSKIGSTPELKKDDVIKRLYQMKQYMERRAPKRIRFVFPNPEHESEEVLLNANLFDWVIENLLRNALDAMDGEGTIEVNTYNEHNNLFIDITDSGKGISAGLHKTVFEPGFTTRKRGWGLGLSLSKRIIEHYHAGKIYVKKSEPGAGTTFTIKLPK